MKRCLPRARSAASARPPAPTALLCALALAACVLASAIASPVVFAQSGSTSTEAERPAGREFPARALRGTLRVVNTPEVMLDGAADRLSPGVRIRNTNNSLVLPGELMQAPVVVNYARNFSGEIHEVWILSADEAKVKRPTAQQQASDREKAKRAGVADPATTPYDQLPKWNPVQQR
jgi:hypothetical protein